LDVRDLLGGGVVQETSDNPLTLENLFKTTPELERSPTPKMHKLPVVNSIAANHLPTFSRGAETEMVDVKYSKDKHYCLQVNGHSMKPTIYEGDRVIVESTRLILEEFDPERGPADKRAWLKLHEEVVCACVNDSDPVLKRLCVYDSPKEEGGFVMYLQSDNRKLAPIIVKKETRLIVVGIVKSILRDPKNYE